MPILHADCCAKVRCCWPWVKPRSAHLYCDCRDQRPQECFHRRGIPCLCSCMQQLFAALEEPQGGGFLSASLLSIALRLLPAVMAALSSSHMHLVWLCTLLILINITWKGTSGQQGCHSCLNATATHKSQKLMFKHTSRIMEVAAFCRACHLRHR